MKVKYTFHPGDYDIGGNENYYTDMAAKGWLLSKRGQYFSCFHKSSPQVSNYRVILSKPEYDDFEQELPDDQRIRNEENGWSYVTGSGSIQVYRSTEDTNPSDFYLDSVRTAKVLKGARRTYLLSWLWIITLSFIMFFVPNMLQKTEITFGYICVDLYKQFIEQTATIILMVAFFLLILLGLIYGTYCTFTLLHRVKNGIPLNHCIKIHYLMHISIKGFLLTVAAICLILSAVQSVQYRSYRLTQASDSSFLFLKDMGIQGDHSQFWDFENTIKIHYSLLAKHTEIDESVTADGESYWIIEEVYEFKNSQLARSFIPVLRSTDFYRNPKPEYKRVSVEGLDYAATTHSEYIAVKGNMAYYIFYDGDIPAEEVNVLEALADKLN